MAQGQMTAQEAWVSAASDRGFGVHNGNPLIAAAPEEGDGFILPLDPAPEWFRHVPHDSRGLVFQAVAEYVQNRVAQPAAKKDGATRETVSKAVHDALNGGYKPTRERDKDVVGNEAARMFRSHVERLVRAKKADATDTEIDATVNAHVDTDAGKALLAKFREDVLAKGTYTVSRKGKAKSGSVAIEL